MHIWMTGHDGKIHCERCGQFKTFNKTIYCLTR
jgi:hypothetical protein